MREMNNRRNQYHEPMFNISEPAPAILAIVLVVSHLGFLLAPQSLKETIYAATVLAARNGNVFLEGRPLGNIATLLTHTLAHSNWTHVLTNAGLIFAFGVLTTRAAKNKHIPVLGRLKRGPLVFLVIFLFGALLGALAQWGFWVLTDASVDSVGASTGGAALFATAGWALGGKERMLGFIAIMMAVDAFVIVSGGSSNGLYDPAWIGHFGGFVAGAILAPKLVEPGGFHLNRFR